MKLGVIGLGLGYSFAKYLAMEGHDVVGVDTDMSAFQSPRVDTEMKQILELNDPMVKFSDGYWLLKDSEIVFVFVSTPFREGRISPKNVFTALAASRDVNKNAEYVILSTLPVGTMKEVHSRFADARIVYAPPMVKKHKFLSTFIDPPSSFQMFGGDPSDELLHLYHSIQNAEQIIAPDEVVERAKLSVNLMLAIKIIIANAIGDSRVCAIVEKDPRVGKGYFTPGGAASGPCLPRDLLELEATTDGSLKKIVQTLNEVNGSNDLV